MIQFNGKNGGRAKMIVAIVVILIVVAMVVTTIVGALGAFR